MELSFIRVMLNIFIKKSNTIVIVIVIVKMNSIYNFFNIFKKQKIKKQDITNPTIKKKPSVYCYVLRKGIWVAVY
jgi:hypothetical protein